jgi:hypothetical protein
VIYGAGAPLAAGFAVGIFPNASGALTWLLLTAFMLLTLCVAVYRIARIPRDGGS